MNEQGRRRVVRDGEEEERGYGRPGTWTTLHTEGHKRRGEVISTSADSGCGSGCVVFGRACMCVVLWGGSVRSCRRK